MGYGIDDRERHTIVFFPEGAFGPTNNCVGIADVLRRRGHRTVFVVEESFAGTLEARGFEERLMWLTPPAEVEEVPAQFWKDFIRETAPTFRLPAYAFDDDELPGAIDRLPADEPLHASLRAVSAPLRSDAGAVRAAGLIERLAMRSAEDRRTAAGRVPFASAVGEA